MEEFEEVIEFKLPKGYELLRSTRKTAKWFYLVLAKRLSDGKYATWEYNSRSECYWGHYFADYEPALLDYQDRIEKD